VVRVKRGSLVVGKFLTQLTLYAGLATVSVLTMTVVARVLNADFGTGDAALWFLKLILASIAFGLAYVGLTALCSSLVRTSAISLILNVIALFVLWVISFAGGSFFLLPDEKAAAGTMAAMLKTESAWGYLRYASIWHFEPNLLHPNWGVSVPALAVHVGFALVCLGAATVVLRKRDV
jgi:ABC-type transport system involved in multi-copper enzyme maturation permease subunit